MSLADISADCLVALDANVLLAPFGFQSQDPVPQLRRIYTNLVKEHRLVVPAHALREFAHNRPKKIGELYQQVLDLKSKALPSLIRAHPLLSGVESYKNARELAAKLRKIHEDYQAQLSRVAEFLKDASWDDPVSQLYADVLDTAAINELSLSYDVLEEDIRKRIKLSIPPGYKDATKDENPAGDIIIWNTILEVGKTQKRNLIFVTNERKSDWWHLAGSTTLFPRYELQMEYGSASGGQILRMIDFSGFLELFGATPEVVKEARVQSEVSVASRIGFALGGAMEMAAVDWAITRFQPERVLYDEPAQDYDFELVTRRGARVGFRVVTMAKDISRARLILRRLARERPRPGLELSVWIVVTQELEDAGAVTSQLEDVALADGVALVIGVVEPGGEFLAKFEKGLGA